ncbi:MAG: hypothetical protein Q7S77_01435 [Candidatus Staskawiczbacteria bacterium]|nr:hypothetical protein [Candidatus Staskawiczbacteria bacterium]
MCWFCESSDEEREDAVVRILVATDGKGNCSAQEAEEILGRSTDEHTWEMIQEQLIEEQERRQNHYS